MFEVGRVCLKLAGRDAGKRCIIVDVQDSNFVLIDGETRRRKCNVKHLEPLNTVVKIRKAASHENVAEEFNKLGFGLWKTKPKKAAQRVLPVRKYDPGKAKKQGAETASQPAAEAKEKAETQEKAPKQKPAKKSKSKEAAE
ncbi:50S ribosomal protein L14e [Candidatus Woesearchaeota archaeon]|nr:50S ribosomal protein L14e [Candidatus Woesearchaeota archaeon]